VSFMHGKGFFIVLEGLDGAGKTTIALMLRDELSRAGIPVLYTYEPTDSEVVKAVKSTYNDLRDAYIDALAFALDRLIHLKMKVKPFLEKGGVVISDRYYYSSVAYQSASGAPFEWVMEVNRFALKPDVAIYLDIDPATGLSRKTAVSSRFPEFEHRDFLERVRRAYLKMVEMGLLVYIDSLRPLETVYSDVKKAISRAIPGFPI